MSAELNIQGTHHLAPWMAPETQFVRINGHEFLKEVSNEYGLQQSDTLGATALAGGIMSACYAIDHPSLPLVVKFSAQAKPSQGEVLAAWHAKGIKVPKVYAYGLVASTANTAIPVDYTIMEAVRNKNNNPAPSADQAVGTDMNLVANIGTIVGNELARMHELPAHTNYCGSRSIIGEFNNSTPTWSMYVQQEFTTHVPVLKTVEPDRGRIQALGQLLADLPWQAPTYLHNDPSLRNVLVSSAKPVIKIIDPNVLVGDPHWDMAHFANKVLTTEAYAKTATGDLPPYNNVVASEYYRSARHAYEQQSQSTLDERRLQACQLLRLLKSLAWFNRPHHNPDRRLLAQNVVKHSIASLLDD